MKGMPVSFIGKYGDLQIFQGKEATNENNLLPLQNGKEEKGERGKATYLAPPASYPPE